jgi:RNA polymerase sigma-70 factor (ECF subfamily)
MMTRTWAERARLDWSLRVTPPDRGPADADWSAADDSTLVRACLEGRREAFDPIVERHRRQVYQVCFRFSGNHADASDLTQEAFVRAYKGLRGFKGHASLATWLYRIAVNVCLNRAALKTPPASALDAREIADQSAEHPDQALLRGERAARVRAAILRLPRTQRATLILRIYHDLRHDEIAGILGSSVGAVKANFFHALANLRKQLR